MTKKDSVDPSAMVNAGMHSIDDELLDLIEEVDAEGSAADNAKEADASEPPDSPSTHGVGGRVRVPIRLGGAEGGPTGEGAEPGAEHEAEDTQVEANPTVDVR